MGRKKMNLLITGAWQQATDYISEIEKKHTVRLLQYEKDALPFAPTWVEGVICNGFCLSHAIESFQNLRYIQLTSAGFDRVPMEYVRAHAIEIHNARGVYSIPMAESAICGVLQLYKQSRFFVENQKNHKWEKHRGLIELYGKTVGIVGCGSVGSECAKRFRALGCRVLGVDVALHESGDFDAMFPLDRLDDVLGESDITVLTLPFSPETWHLMNAEKFDRMKPRALFVNIARGAVVDTDALIVALRDKLGGAVLDVFEDEPLSSESPLWDMENVLITPHNSFVGDGNTERLSAIVINNLKTNG